MAFNDRSRKRFLRLPRRMAGAAAVCAAAAACSGYTQEPARQDAARRPMGMGMSSSLMIPHAVTTALKQQRATDRRMDSWRLTRSRLQQEYDLEGVIGEGRRCIPIPSFVEAPAKF
ncbi:hypothetical protein PC112_g8428 [Phytophthora cactorum]|nr:hypothetical protein PC112_g8428 [Phytophthora cactorum]